MPGTQEITRRLKSIKSTRKITRAMQMVSAAKMRKAQNATLASRNYADLAWELIASLGPTKDFHSPLMEKFPEAKKLGIVIVSTNRGLVGSFNTNLYNKLKEVERQHPELQSEIIVMGRKARDLAARNRQTIIAEFTKLDATIPVDEIYPLAELITENYKTGEYKKIVVIYNRFISTLIQKPTAKEILPLIPTVSEGSPLDRGEPSAEDSEFIFEPSPQKVLEHLLPRIIESQLYQAVLENDASEHSARMIMMKNATEASGDLIDDLTLTFNRLRQSKITTELSEITAGKIALEKG
jgi:F-type H+-transporting ATPase subunit gamma